MGSAKEDMKHVLWKKAFCFALTVQVSKLEILAMKRFAKRQVGRIPEFELWRQMIMQQRPEMGQASDRLETKQEESLLGVECIHSRIDPATVSSRHSAAACMNISGRDGRTEVARPRLEVGRLIKVPLEQDACKAHTTP